MAAAAVASQGRRPIARVGSFVYLPQRLSLHAAAPPSQTAADVRAGGQPPATATPMPTSCGVARIGRRRRARHAPLDPTTAPGGDADRHIGSILRPPTPTTRCGPRCGP